MRIQLTIRDTTAVPAHREVVVECPAGTRAEELRAALGASQLTAAGRSVADSSLVGWPPLLEGAVVALDTPASGSAAPSPWELWVVDGPDVGLRFPLATGRSVIGRAEEAAVRLMDPLASRRHAEVAVGPRTEVTVKDLGGSNGTSVCGRRLDRSSRPLMVGDTVEVGGSRLQLTRMPRDANLGRPDGEGHLIVPGAEGRTAPEPEEISFPDSPAEAARMRFPLIALAVPLLLAGVLAAAMRSPTMLLFGLTGPVLSLATWLAERRRNRGRQRSCPAQVAVVTEAHAGLARAVARERATLDEAHPSLSRLLAMTETRSGTIWRGGGTDVRVGIGARTSNVVLKGDTAPVAPTHERAPMTVDLVAIGVLGVHGERTRVISSMAAVLARLTAGMPPSRLEVDVLVGEAGFSSEWGFASRLPHTRAVAATNEAGAVVDDLVAEIARREEADRVRAPPPQRPLVVVVVDGWPAAWSGLGDAARRGPAVGMLVLAVAESRSQLPSACGAVLSLGPDTARLSTGDSSVAIVPDLPGRRWVCRFVRSLAPLRETSRWSEPEDLPLSVRLLDLVDELDGTSLAQRWARDGSSTRAVLGVAGSGPLIVDLVTDGPHVLVAGTTGAGKSELLQTLVCSLALVNRPDEMTFLLVDYKGGAAFRGCAQLPHVVGVVTDLDGHLTARALTSLTAELRRRERLLAELGVSNVDEYGAARGRDSALPRLPRVVIVVDEFRILAEELPDFVHGLVRLAAVGRSLGVHLVLATQRPGGIVSADIRANVSLRIALRVRDRTDSIDVIDAPDAASIDATTPGRGSVRGATTPLTRFQSARVTGGPRARPRLTVTPVASARVTPRAGQQRLATDMGTDSAVPLEAPPVGRRDLDRIAVATREAALALHIADPRSPWLPPLPDAFEIRSLQSATEDSVPLGLEDHPTEQAQSLWCWSFDRGHLGIAGGGRSGRTTAVLTVAAQLARSLSPTELHLYSIGPPALAALTALPHVAVVADVDDLDHVRLVVERLRSIAGVADRDKARPVLLLDGWERLAGHTHGSLATEVSSLLGASTGSPLRALVTGGRAVLAGQLAPLFAQRLVLRLGDPVDLAIAGIPTRAVPLRQPPGRALDAATHREIQIATIGDQPSDVVSPISRHWTGAREDARGPRADQSGWPRPVRRLPESVAFTFGGEPHDVLPVGVRDGDLERVGFDAERGDRRILVVGPPGSGRSTTLDTITAALAASGWPVAVLSARWAFAAGPSPSHVDAALTLAGHRDEDRDALIKARRDQPNLAVVVDDVDRLTGLPIEPVLLEIARRVDEDRGVVVAATSTLALDARIGAVATDLARAHTGIVLWPSPGHAALGIQPPAAAAPSRIPGRGLLVTPRGVERIQVATISRPR
jgi:DNA segregation ATPase FtsK/SpoIIIE, S-DNA-T family